MLTGIDLSNLEFPEVVSAETKNDSIRFDYVVRSDKVDVHVWPVNKVFPANIKAVLMEGLASMSDYVKIIEFVPEMDSWYIELSGFPVKPTGAMLESLFSKILAAQVRNGR